jgi:phage terminase large subunit
LSILRVDVPRAFKPLLTPKRYKGAHGGRGSGKSHFLATQMIVQCFRQLTRAVGIREIQLSIRDSVRQLLADKIQQLDLGRHFTVLDTEIRCDNGSNIVFRGMQSYNAETIKSLEGYDLAWVEEAQTLSQKSLDLLRPTIRKPGSEMWFGWNPRFRTDPVDVFFRKHPSPEKISVEANWRDNPWFPDVLRKDMETDKADDPERAEHVWEGGYEIGQGAILARWIERAEKAGRINDDVAYDPSGPGVEISCDIGFRDTTTVWFWQRRIGGAVVFDYDRDSGLEASDWIDRIKKRLTDKKLKLGCVWLPHDARNKTFSAKYTAVEQFLHAFGVGRVAIVPISSKPDRINAARTFIKRVEFNKTACEVGLDGLRAWQFEWDEENRIFSREPKHDFASHDGDGFSYGCQVMTGQAVPEQEQEKPPLRGAENMTVDEMLAQMKPPRAGPRV